MAHAQQNSLRLLLHGEKPPERSCTMNGKYAVLVIILMLALPLFTWAQEPEEKGQMWGDYEVHQSVEVGGHIADTEGNNLMYRTFVNVQSGPRLLEQELSMRSTTHRGALFDNLYVSSFGFGGDPEDMARIRMQKNKWYNLVGLYRRDENFFDYNLFANPLDLNAGSVTCGVGCTNGFIPSALSWYTNSPHLQDTTRNMGDITLTLLPESVVSIRLGYARNATHGRFDTTLESPLRTVLSQNSQWRSDRYQVGVDVKVLPRTTISGDFFIEHDKNDFDFVDNNLLYRLGNASGPLIDPGILVPPLGGSTPTCAGAGVLVISASGLFRIDSGCRGILLNTGPGGAYFKRGNIRTHIPTGQFSLQSTYFRNLDITASATYSAASSDFLNFREFIHGGSPFGTTTNVTDLNSGVPKTERVSANADFGVTYRIGEKWSIQDKFRWLNWREPGGFNNTLFRCSLPSGAVATPTGFPAGPVTLTPFRNPCLPEILALTGLTTSGNATSGTYEQITAYATLLGELSYFNTFQVNWQPNRRFSGYIGYRFARREQRMGEVEPSGVFSLVTTTFTNNGTGLPPTVPTITTETGELEAEHINLHSVLAGVVMWPVDAWRINADVEWLSADNSFTNISPRHQQRFRIYSTYKPKSWLSLNGGVRLVETRNDFAAAEVVEGTSTPLFPTGGAISPYGHKDHWRYYTLGAGINPNSKVTFDLGWTLLDQDIRSATCLPVASNAFGSLTPPTVCANGSTAGAVLLHYQETTNSGYVNVFYQPVKRVTLNLGYAITGDNGRTNWLRLDTGLPLQVVGDIYGNVPPLAGNPITPCPGPSVATGCVYPGPFPDQPLGPQAINWHKANAGVAVELTKGVQFKGLWSYYDYNSKDEVPALSLLRVTAPRSFHANVGTLSLRYNF